MAANPRPCATHLARDVRNAEIYALFSRGVTTSEIAQRFGLGRAQVSDIVKPMRERLLLEADPHARLLVAVLVQARRDASHSSPDAERCARVLGYSNVREEVTTFCGGEWGREIMSWLGGGYDLRKLMESAEAA